jgi:hypothetical protein
MAVPSSTLGRFQGLPFVAKLAIGFLAFMAVIWLRNWLGATSVLLATLLWCVVGIGVLYASGFMTWADRYPAVTRILDGFAPRFTTRMPPVEPPPAPGHSSGGLPPRSSSGAKATAGAMPAATDLTRFAGIEGVFDEIHSLVAARASRTNTAAPATLVLLVGPRGTGKSSVALALAADLHQAGAIQSDRIIAISESDMPGLGSSYGPTDTVLTAVNDRIRAALDGTLLIEDLDGLVGSPEGRATGELGSRILSVARAYPGRLFIVATGSAEAAGRLDPGNRWLGQLNVRRIDFPALSPEALRTIFLQQLATMNLRLAPGAERALHIQIEERRQQRGEAFDNAYAIRRLVDDVLHSQTQRLRGDTSPTDEARRIVTAEDIRNAVPTL